MMSFEEEEDLAAKFAADLCAEDRLDMGNDVLMSGEQIHLEKRKRSINDVQRLNPLLKEGQWAPDLTLMYPPKFTNEVKITYNEVNIATEITLNKLRKRFSIGAFSF